MSTAKRSISKLFRKIACLAAWVALCSVYCAGDNDPFARISVEQRQTLKKRLDDYVKVQRNQDWANLFDMVSDTGKGGVNREKFVAAMSAGHGRDFANEPDLLEFLPKRTEPGSPDGFDVYGCANATREGQSYRGIAITHVVFEHNTWFFADWTFTDISDHSCKALDDPSWHPPAPMKWTTPMEELRSISGQRIHIETPNTPHEESRPQDATARQHLTSGERRWARLE
jgi:hypothetical protein